MDQVAEGWLHTVTQHTLLQHTLSHAQPTHILPSGPPFTRLSFMMASSLLHLGDNDQYVLAETENDNENRNRRNSKSPSRVLTVDSIPFFFIV